MDIDLGKEMDGTEAAKTILQDYDISLIFLSNHTGMETVQKTDNITANQLLHLIDGILMKSKKLFYRQNLSLILMFGIRNPANSEHAVSKIKNT